MKKLIVFAFAAMLAFACNKEPNTQTVEPADLVDVTLSVDLTGALTRALDFDMGGLTNVVAPAPYSIRYIVEAYTPAGAFVKRFVRYEDLGTGSTEFNFALPAAQYTLVGWADFINPQTATAAGGYDTDEAGQGGLVEDLYYATASNLRNVSIVAAEYSTTADLTDGGRMTRDAYTGTANIDIRVLEADITMTLTRPFGRIEVISTAMEAIAATGFQPATTASVTYTSIFNGYDAFAQDALATTTAGATFTEQIEDYTGLSQATISYDYLFAPANGQGSVSFTLTVEDATATQIITNVPFPAIPFERNKRTLITGPLFGQLVRMDVIIDDTFIDQIAFVNATDFSAMVAGTPAGGTLVLQSGNYDAAGLTLDQDITIEAAPGANVVLYATNPPLILPTGTPGSAPALHVTGGVTVTLDGVTISTNKTTTTQFDGITVDGGSTLNLNNVTFDGIEMASGVTGVQTGRALVAYDSTVNVTDCTFENYNKNAADMIGNSVGNFTNCTVIGGGLSSTNPLAPGQNGFVFRTGSSGSVTDCSFSNITYDGSTASAILLYQLADPSVVTITNCTYTNCDVDVNIA